MWQGVGSGSFKAIILNIISRQSLIVIIKNVPWGSFSNDCSALSKRELHEAELQGAIVAGRHSSRAQYQQLTQVYSFRRIVTMGAIATAHTSLLLS